MKYDYFLAGRWRNHAAIREVLHKLREANKTVYCFVENSYDGDNIVIDAAQDADVEDFMGNLEAIDNWKDNSTFKQIYENDMNGLKNAKESILVFPAGLSAHMELGVAYGIGKKCYGIGAPAKAETLYLMFDEIFPDVESFLEARVGAPA